MARQKKYPGHLLPRRPRVTCIPRGPKLTLGPDFDRFSRTPGMLCL